MTYEELITLPIDDFLTEVQTMPAVARTEQANIDYYKGAHPILTDSSRADTVEDTYETDANGQMVLDSNGRRKVSGSRKVTRARIVLPYPQQIINTKVAMIAGNGVDLFDETEGGSDVFSLFKKQFDSKLKMKTVVKDAVRTCGIETHCALIFFFKNADPKEGIKVKLLSKANGDTIYPYFDSDGDLIAFTRTFVKKTIIDGKVEDINVIQVYTADKVITKEGDDDSTEVVNAFGKIPVVYFDQVYSEFELIKDLISKQEYSTSQLYEVNRRIGNPPILITGDITAMPDASSDVKIFTAKSGTNQDGSKYTADMKLIESQTAPDSIKLQHEILDENIQRGSWQDLNKLFELAKGSGTSGFALTIAMTATFATRAAQIGIFEDGMTRCISIIKTMLSKTAGGAAYETLEVGFEFKPLLPEDMSQLTTILAEAKQAGLTSDDQAVKLWPWNEDPVKIIEEINTIPNGIS